MPFRLRLTEHRANQITILAANREIDPFAVEQTQLFSSESSGMDLVLSNTLAEWRRRLVGRPSLAVVWRGDFTTAWEGRPTSLG